MSELEIVKHGDMVKIHYTGSFENGEVFDTTEGEEPHEFPAGTGVVIQGLDQAVIGMKVDEEKELTVKADMAYGARNENLIQSVPRDIFPPEEAPEEGMMVMMSTKEGHDLPAMIHKVSEKDVELDFNHPLAGKALNFKIKVVGISPGMDDSCGCGCGCGDIPGLVDPSGNPCGGCDPSKGGCG